MYDEVIDTKRKMLSLCNSIFDPIGLLAPFRLKGKMMFQRAMKEVDGWDTKLPDDLVKEFDTWRQSISKLEKFAIPRWIATPSTTNSMPEMHVFSDASLEGYGIAVYRVAHSDDGGENHVALIWLRPRVVPNNSKGAGHHNSVPRLELVAAVMGVEDRQKIQNWTGEVFSKIVHWTDSECVLKWLNCNSKQFKTFVHNRISRIDAIITSRKEFRYCPTALNPADDVSRGLDPDDANWRRFHNGPDFLRQGEEFWPINEIPSQPLPADVFATLADDAPVPPLPVPLALAITERIEHWSAKVRRIFIVTKLFKLFLRWRGNGEPVSCSSLRFSSEEMKRAENDLTRDIQKRYFSAELTVLQKLGINAHDCRDEMKNRSSPLKSLNPFLDADGIIRTGGRLANAVSFSYEAKFPKILPRKDANVDALIRHVHQREGHSGVEHVHSSLRREWWILQGRRAVRAVVHLCIPCQRAFKPPAVQKLGSLPVQRLEPDYPFSTSGVDVFGPYAIKLGKSRASTKVYGLICTCFTSRAVHLEPLEDLSTTAFIRALSRIQARRPAIRRLYSDNGTNLRSANEEFKKAFEAWSTAELVGDNLRQLEWEFIPPYTSFRGGIYERLIRSTKRILTMIMEKERITYDHFHTILVAAEAILNRRPITQVSADVRDTNAITPMDVLCPGTDSHSGAYIFPPDDPNEDSFRYAWATGRQLINSFWKSWRSDYLASLQQRKKWLSTRKNLKVGQLVLLVDDTKYRDLWQLGRVHEVNGDATHIRKASIRCGNGKLVLRDRTKIVPLEFDLENE